MNSTLHGVMVYEDISLAKLAMEMWNFTVDALQHDHNFELRLWRFGVLEIPELRAAAVQDAIEAEVIFIVTRGKGELPAEVKTWFEQWLALKDGNHDEARLLLFLFDSSARMMRKSSLSQFTYLQQAACRGSMDFMSSIITIPDWHSTVPRDISIGVTRLRERGQIPSRAYLRDQQAR